MRLLASLLRQWRRPPVDGDDRSGLSRPASDVGYREIAPQFLQLIADGSLAKAFHLFMAADDALAGPSEALHWLRELVVPYLLACERQGNADAACNFEELTYSRLIRAFELPAHYEACFAEMDGVLHRIGKAGRVQRDTENSQPVRIDSSGRLLFYLHNASSAAAHVPLLCDVLDGYLELHPELGDTFGIAGSVFAHYAARLQELAHRWGVRLLATDERAGRYRSYEDAVRRVDDGEFDRLVVCAPPIGVSYLSGRLAPRHLAWFTMKFELNCFEHLAHRASIISSLKTPSAARQPKRWLQAPPFLTRPVALAPSSVLPAPIALARQQHQAVLYTINREQKIRNPDFLATVAETLDRVPGACFVWTGRERLEEIDTFFQARGLLERIYFAGWVNPDDLLAVGDVFLDTPVLSGTIAARAAAAGCALVTFAQSQSWINVYARIHEGDLSTGRSTWEPPADPETRTSGSTPQFEFATRAEYVAAAVRLAVDPAFRARYGRALRDFAEHYFFDKARWAELHLAHLQDGL